MRYHASRNRVRERYLVRSSKKSDVYCRTSEKLRELGDTSSTLSWKRVRTKMRAAGC